MASENQGMNYPVPEAIGAENQEDVNNQETTDNLPTNLELTNLPKTKIICVRSREEEGKSSTVILPNSFFEGYPELAEVVAFNLLDSWKHIITWLCIITKDQNIWTFEISLWDLWCSSYDFQEYLKMMYIYFWALQFKGVQVKLTVIIETVVYRRCYFTGNDWYATTDEVEDSEKQFARDLFRGIPMVEIREDPEEVFTGNSLSDQELE